LLWFEAINVIVLGANNIKQIEPLIRSELTS